MLLRLQFLVNNFDAAPEAHPKNSKPNFLKQNEVFKDTNIAC
jgi:hypothetical protein